MEDESMQAKVDGKLSLWAKACSGTGNTLMVSNATFITIWNSNGAAIL